MPYQYIVDRQSTGDKFKAVTTFRIIKAHTRGFYLMGVPSSIGGATLKIVGQHIRGISPEHAKLLEANQEQTKRLKQQRRALLREAFENGRRLGAAELKGKFEP